MPDDALAAAEQAAASRHAPGAVSTYVIRTVLSAATPVIEAAERRRILALLDGWTCPCGETGCSAYDNRDRLAALIEETP